MFILFYFSFPVSSCFSSPLLCGSCPHLIGCLHAVFLLAVCYLFCFLCFAQSGFCFRGSRSYFIWWRKSCPFETGRVVFFYLWCVKEFSIHFYFFQTLINFVHGSFFMEGWCTHMQQASILCMCDVSIDYTVLFWSLFL